MQPKKEKHRIDLKEAVELTARWRKNHPDGFKCARFERGAFDRLLDQPGAVGIKIYMGEKKDGAWTFVMVAVDKENRDMVGKNATGLYAEEGGDIEDQADPCPPDCDDESPLDDDCNCE